MTVRPGTVVDQHLLVPYLPRLVIDWLEESPEKRDRTVEGTVAFVDISGFTKLSEGLAKHGKIGAEELAATIGECFVALLEIAYEAGGRLLKFGGDALLLLFTGVDHEARACRTAYEMRSKLRKVGRMTVLGQRVTLRMSIGVHSGRFDFFLLGASHRELLVTGPAATTTVSMEAMASAGEIVVSERTAAALSASHLGAAKDAGRLLRRCPIVTSSPTPRDEVEPKSDLAGCIPRGILDSALRSGHEAEHRRVTVAFLHFDGTDAMFARSGADAVADYLDTLITDVQAAVDGQGITFLGTDIDHDGGKVILVAGAPSTSGDDEHRMLLALRQIMERERSPAVRIGVNRGPVFAGDIGPSYRRTFTVMGDAVNLAARLMAKATPGQILATPEVVSRAGSRFDVTAVEPFYVKGKAKPVEAFDVGVRLGARRAETRTRLSLIGRSSEMEQWREAVEAMRRSSGSVMEVVGEPGAGKSRLIEEFRTVTEGVTTFTVTGEYYDASTPYGALRGTIRELLGLEESGEPPTPEQLRRAIGRIAPDLAPWAPLVGAVVDVALPDTPETSELDPAFRSQRLGEAMVDLFIYLLPDPTVIFVEDAHWVDDASSDLLRHVAASVDTRPWLLCLTRRDQETGFVALEETSVQLRLEPLGGAEATQLVQATAGDAPLPPHVVATLAERSGGNPLFLLELVSAARDSDDIDSLPDSVEAVIAARIDRLSVDDRRFLRRVSVLGRTTPLTLLAAVLDEVPGAGDTIWERLEQFVSVDAGGNLTFRHALLRDGAYNGLSYRLRRQLHASAGAAIRDAAGDRADEHAEMLSLHYLHAQSYQEAWTYSLVAAERARAVHANVEAAEFFERALAASRRLPELTAQQVAEVTEALGDARDKGSEYLGAVTAYRAARRLVRDDRLADARLMLKLARAQGWLDRYSNALRWITRALHTLDDAEDDLPVQRQRAQLLAWYGWFCGEQGHHARAMTWCSRAIAQAEQAGDKEALANALSVLDWARMELGTLEDPTNTERALALMEELGDLGGQARVLNSLAIYVYFRGGWDDALDIYRRAEEMARRAGNVVHQGIIENNMAEIALDQGRVDEADQLFESVARVCRAAGHRSGEAYVKGNMARAAAKSGRYEEAVRLFAESSQEAETLGSHAESLEANARWAECQLLAGDVDGARLRAEAQLERARALGAVAPVPLLHRVRGVALARQGDREGAIVALHKSLDAARVNQVDYEVALTLRVIVDLGLDDGERTSGDLARESDRILEALGVVWVPDLLAPTRSPGPVVLASPTV
jgi:class 3 adenylate cyclase/tetratricopeptide (TPR) repeat protein